MALIVEPDIPFGNVCAVEVNDRASPPTVSFAASPSGGPECLWFCFRIRRSGRGRPGGQFKLILKHIANLLGGVGKSSVFRPVIRREDQLWERLPAGEAGEAPDGQTQISWTLPQPDGHLEVAFCYPYGLADVQRLVERSAGLDLAEIGVSQGGRSLWRISNGAGELHHERPGLYLVARQHAGETPGSWVLDGMINRLAALGPNAPLFWAVPLADMDGVEAGAYGKDRYPYDLNRAWGQLPMRHEIMVLQHDIHRWMQRCKPILILDFHAPGACESEGIYCYLNQPEEYRSDYQRALLWARHLARALSPDYSAALFVRTMNYPSRWETPRCTQYAQDTLGVSALTLETPYALCGNTLMTPDKYQDAGQRIADSIVEHIGELSRPNAV